MSENTKNIEVEEKKNLLTVADIISRKKYFSNRQDEVYELYCESLGYSIEIKKARAETLSLSLSMNDEESDLYLLQECIVTPNLKDKGLLKAFNCENSPLDIVSILFSSGEINSIAQKIIEKSGYNSKYEFIEKIKN